MIMNSTVLRTAILVPCFLASIASAQKTPERETRYITPADWMNEIDASVAAGKILDPSKRARSRVQPLRGPSLGAAPLSNNVIFPFEDTNSVLIGAASPGELFALMADAANAVVAAHGDDFDFVGYWMNFDPSFQLGAAFYLPIQNDVLGIGDPSLAGTPIFNQGSALGLASQKIQGFVMMHNINSGFWAAGNGPKAAFTRLVLAQEFGHRFGMFLPNLLDGRGLQGDDAGCGRSAHWNFRVDGQGSGMEIGEWVGANPAAFLSGSFGISFNTDSSRSVFSFPDLYLMGYVSDLEMDANMSEFRYMDDDSVSCATGASYNGPISSISSGDIIASAGLRVPDVNSAQKEFRCAWVMIHQPGSPPTRDQVIRATGIANQQQNDWHDGTLGRGTIDNSLFDIPHSNPIVGQSTSLSTDLQRVSLGQTVSLNLDAGSIQAGKSYRLLGSFSGSYPGIPISDKAHLPLNFDSYLRLTMTRSNAFIFNQFVGHLDPAGRAQASLTLPKTLDPAFIGQEVQHAFVTLDDSGRVSFVSNVVTLVLDQ